VCVFWRARLAILAAGAAAVLAGLVAGPARATGVTAIAAATAGRQAATSYSTAGGLAGVAAVSPSSAWAVGSAGAASPTVLTLHWNGKPWSRVTSPKVLDGTAGGLTAITVVSATDAWAVGGTVSGGTWHTLVLHWNGKAWSQVTSPTPIAGGSPTVMITGALARWNGKTWSWARNPLEGAYQPLEGIAAGPGGAAFAVGDDKRLGRAGHQHAVDREGVAEGDRQRPGELPAQRRRIRAGRHRVGCGVDFPFC
jgi:hypothetical protein